MSEARDKIRGAVLSTKSPATKVIPFFGEDIELRQPTLGALITAAAAAQEGGSSSAVIDTLVNYAYVPGTDEKVFEDSDSEMLKTLPFGPDFNLILETITELSGVDFAGKPKTSEAEPSST